jgi:hypothetical protein
LAVDPPKKPSGRLGLVASKTTPERSLATAGIADADAAFATIARVAEVSGRRDGNDNQEAARLINATAVRMHALAPADALEGMTSALLVAVQDAALVALAATTQPVNDPAIRCAAGARAERLLRAFVNLADLRCRLRGGGTTQRVTVEHVTVTAGGQAVIGAVSGAGGGAGPARSSDLPHAQA